jgi:hypothetical protein
MGQDVVLLQVVQCRFHGSRRNGIVCLCMQMNNLILTKRAMQVSHRFRFIIQTKVDEPVSSCSMSVLLVFPTEIRDFAIPTYSYLYVRPQYLPTLKYLDSENYTELAE